MITVLLAILKIIGIVLACVLGVLLTLLLLVLFVPVRYRITACRREEDQVPVRVSVKVTWLLHILNAAFRFPEEAFLKVRLFCFTVFSTDKSSEKEKKKKAKAPKEKETSGLDAVSENAPEKERTVEKETVEKETAEEKPEREEKAEETAEEKTEKEKQWEEDQEEGETQNKLRMLLAFFKRLIDRLKNMQYTIEKICDKIKEIIKNIRYYLEILQSDTFKRAYAVCGGEVLGLLRDILPRKVRGSFRIGTGDPASTAQIIGIQGILYPLIGEHITITPDFDRTVAEGDLFIKGKITLFRALKTAVKVYFNKDLRRVIRLLKKEAA